MAKALKLYDLTLGFLLGVAATLLIEGDHNKAMAVALIAVGLRFTVGRAIEP